MSSVRLTRLFHPVSGIWVRWTTGRPSRSSTPARKVMYWSRSGTTRTSATVRPTSCSTASIVRCASRGRARNTVSTPRSSTIRATSAVVPSTGTPRCSAARLPGASSTNPTARRPASGMLEKLVDHGAAEAAGADDEDVPHADAVAPGLLEYRRIAVRPAKTKQHVETEEEEKDEPRVREAPVERREPREQQRGQPRRDEDREPLLDPRAVPADLVEAVEVVDDRPQDGDQGEEPIVRGRVRNPLGDRDDLRPEAQEVGGEERDERGAHVRDGEQRAMRRVDFRITAARSLEGGAELLGEPFPGERQRRGADSSVIESDPTRPAEGLRQSRGRRSVLSIEDAVDAVARRCRRRPPRARATTGAPQARASTAAMPKSSSPGCRKSAQER